VLEHFGYSMYLFRYPAGRFNERSLAIVSNCNYKSVFWSFAYVDYDVNSQPDPAQSLAKLKERLHPGAIYLLHAESETNASILGDLIDYIREQGYSLGTL
jgi:peptidoglycan/xylan/chitin deacetylase (PgdA/CDA1 family)